jgi:hypothetical protein
MTVRGNGTEEDFAWEMGMGQGGGRLLFTFVCSLWLGCGRQIDLEVGTNGIFEEDEPLYSGSLVTGHPHETKSLGESFHVVPADEP